jgi:hypothetical protein
VAEYKHRIKKIEAVHLCLEVSEPERTRFHERFGCSDRAGQSVCAR